METRYGEELRNTWVSEAGDFFIPAGVPRDGPSRRARQRMIMLRWFSIASAVSTPWTDADVFVRVIDSHPRTCRSRATRNRPFGQTGCGPARSARGRQA
jgi:hypothetical protein